MNVSKIFSMFVAISKSKRTAHVTPIKMLRFQLDNGLQRFNSCNFCANIENELHYAGHVMSIELTDFASSNSD